MLRRDVIKAAGAGLVANLLARAIAEATQTTPPATSGPDLPKNIGLKMQYQETKDWCWIAVATSIDHFYNPASTSTQSSIMTTVGQTINKWPSTTICSPNAVALASEFWLGVCPGSPLHENHIQYPWQIQRQHTGRLHQIGWCE